MVAKPLDGGNLLRDVADPLRVNPVTEKSHRGLGDHTLVHGNCQVVGTEAGENLPQMVLLLFDRPAAH